MSLFISESGYLPDIDGEPMSDDEHEYRAEDWVFSPGVNIVLGILLSFAIWLLIVLQ